MGQQSSLAAASDASWLDTPTLQYHENPMARGLTYFCTRFARKPCGEERLYSDDVVPSTGVFLALENTTPRKILDALVAQLPDSQWEIRSGVINIEPRNRGEDLLGRNLSSVSAHNVSSFRAALDLFDDAGINISYTELGRPRHFGTIDIELQNVTVREALNAIAKADDGLMWIFVHSRNPSTQRQGSLLFFTTRTMGKTSSEERKETKRWKREHPDKPGARPN